MNLLTDEQISTLKTLFPEMIEDEPMARHTSFRTGGNARLYVSLSEPERIIRAVELATESRIPWTVFGGGSNLLVADEGYKGLVIQMSGRDVTIDGMHIRAESGLISGLLARKTVEAGLTGFEWAIGLPGTIGGATYGNAGCYGGEMKDFLISVDAYDVTAKKRVRLTRAECGFGYRESRFKKEHFIIFAVELELPVSLDKEQGKVRMQEIMKTRREKQPLDQSSAGCAFKNYEFKNESELEILAHEVEIPTSMRTQKILGAGWLIDQAGLLGTRVGDVEVSQKHGNFLLNKGNLRAEDVISLISLIKRKVRDQFGIELHEEVQLLGFE